MIGVVALIVIGPEKLPRVARTVGALLGKAQRYVSDVKAEVNRSMDLEELKKMKESVESAARDVQSSVQDGANDFEKSWSDATAGLGATDAYGQAQESLRSIGHPSYTRPNKRKKNWRASQAALPMWFKVQVGVRTKAQSGAARVARFRPKPHNGGF